MQKRKLFTLLSATALIAAVGVGSTMAYLSDKSNTLTNEFVMTSVGINMNLQEHDVMRSKSTGAYIRMDGIENVDPEHGFGDFTGKDEVVGGNSGIEYKDLQPGEVVPKDPYVSIQRGSVPCYIVVKVDMDNTNLEILDISDNWKPLTDIYDSDTTDGVSYYIYSEDGEPAIVDHKKNEEVIYLELPPVFEHVKVSENIKDHNTTLDDIIVQAAAVQANWLDEDLDPIKMAVDMLNGETTTTENPEA